MVRFAPFLLGLAFAAAPAAASTYSATLSTPASGRFAERDISWNCGPAACRGVTDESRPLVLCQSLAKRVGPIATFAVDGAGLSSAELERCNAFAKALPRASASGK